MDPVYPQLAQHLDNLPAGFPATDSGVELRILQRLFTPEEAQIALGLTMMPEAPGAIAARLERDADALAPLLEEMSRKGLIFRRARKGQNQYMAAQFVVGIWEYHVNDLDEDLIRDVNEYLPHLMNKSFIKQKTKQLRIIPVAQSLDAAAEVMPYEQAEAIIAAQSRILVAPCICRKEHAMMGKGCGRLAEACLVFGSGAYFYEQNGLGRVIEKQEALDILKQGLDQGLVLQPGNSKKPANICLCCGCCCQVLKNLNTLEKPAQVVNANYYAEVDAEACSACGVCAERCQMAAITLEEVAVVDADRCIGCGLCVPTCDFEAMKLKPKTAESQYEPPANTFETYLNIARERGLL
ncbi:MAG: 4Fe-4S binding protein [Desulfobacterales bacterium]